jgi:hypothetical protein
MENYEKIEIISSRIDKLTKQSIDIESMKNMSKETLINNTLSNELLMAALNGSTLNVELPQDADTLISENAQKIEALMREKINLESIDF